MTVGWDLNPGCWGLGKFAVLATRHTIPPHISVLRSQVKARDISAIPDKVSPHPSHPQHFPTCPLNRLQCACFINSSYLFYVVIISFSIGI